MFVMLRNKNTPFIPKAKSNGWRKREVRRVIALSFCITLMFLIATPIIIIKASRNNQDNTENVVSLLQQLCSNVSALPNEAFENERTAENRKNALCNKIGAVINQVESGAYEGSLNKLRNDMEKIVREWVSSPWEESLLILIEQIISLIEGILCPDLTPPVIHSVVYYPYTPEYDETVLVVAYVTDRRSGVANVTLNYFTDAGENVNLTMVESDGLYVVEIPPKPYNVNVTFMVYAWDNAGNLAVSSSYSYVVGDFHPPIITYIEHMPASPNYNETVFVLVNATEPPFASGVKEDGVILSYNNGTAWENVTMFFDGSLYVATIPTLPYGTVVQYRVYAFDNAGNWMAMDVYSYKVEDRFMPVARIDAPACGSYLSGSVNIEVYVYDDNLYMAELKANDTVLALWNASGNYVYTWDTAGFSDGAYVLKLTAKDLAENTAVVTCSVVVDNTAPTLEILQPLNGSFVRGDVNVQLCVDDLNFENATLRIGDDVVQVWETGGNYTYLWKTLEYFDGNYTIVLSALDKAGQEKETIVSVFVDNTAPSFTNLVWVPLEPESGEQVNVSVQILEEGSGVKNASLWFRVNVSEWQRLDMSLHEGNWTCTIPGQVGGANVTFYLECYDNAENFAATLERGYTVKPADEEGDKGAAGFPLSGLLLIIAIIGLVVGSTLYVFKFRKKRA